MPVDENSDGKTDYYRVEATAKLDANVVIPGNVLGIPVKEVEKLYSNNSNLDYSSGVKTITIQEGVEVLLHNSLSYTSDLQTVNLPNSLKELGKNTFSRNWGDDKKELEIVFNGTMAEWKAVKKDSDWHNGLKNGSVVRCTDGYFELDRGWTGLGSYDWEEHPNK